MIIDGKEYVIKLHGKTYHCALDVTMDYLGGKWKMVVLWYLRKGSMRFSELKRQIPDISEKVLSSQLRQLEKQGFINREIFAEVPPRVEYTMTDAGKKLLPILEAIAAWGREKGQEEGSISEKNTEFHEPSFAGSNL